MRPSTLSVCVRLALFAGLGTAAYWTGTWQGTLTEKTALEAKLKRENVNHSSPFDDDPFNLIHPDLSKDSAAGLEKLAELPNDSSRWGQYWQSFYDWAKKPENAPAAAAAALALPPGREQKAAISGLTESWAMSDPKACLDWETSLPNFDSDQLKHTLLGVGVQQRENRQPALAAQYLDKLQDATARNTVIMQIGDVWGLGDRWEFDYHPEDADPGAALDWLEKVATGPTYDTTVGSIFSGMAERDPAKAATLIDKVTDPVDRQSVIDTVAQTWSTKSPQAALDWVQSLPDSETVRNKALNSIIYQMADTDPASAVAFIQNASLPLDSKTTQAIMDSWMDYDPSAALAWANSLPDGPAKTTAVDKGVVALSETDFNSAWNYALTLTANDPTSPIMSDLMSQLAGYDPAKVLTLLPQLPTEADKATVTEVVAIQWATRDPAAFAQWVNTLPPGPQQDKAVSSVLDQFGGRTPVDSALLHVLSQTLQNLNPANSARLQLLTHPSQNNPAP